MLQGVLKAKGADQFPGIPPQTARTYKLYSVFAVKVDTGLLRLVFVFVKTVEPVGAPAVTGKAT